MNAIELPLCDPSQWPLRMKPEEVAHVLRRGVRTLYYQMSRGQFPRPDGDGMWDRALVQRYAEGGIKEFDKRASRPGRLMAMRGGRR